LVFAAFHPEGLEPSPAVAELWKASLSRWSDLERHDRLLQRALAQGELAMLGRLYRIRLAHSPHDPYASRGRDEVLRLAAASSSVLFTERAANRREGPSSWWADPVSRWKLLALVLALLVFAVAFFQALYLLLPSKS
jgi:hypothetical protein